MGDTQRFEVVLTGSLEVLAILEGGTTSFHPLKKWGGGGAHQVIPCLKGGTTSFGPAIFPFGSPLMNGRLPYTGMPRTRQ